MRSWNVHSNGPMGPTGSSWALHWAAGVHPKNSKVAYQRFTRKSVRRTAPFLSIRPDGRVRINSDATKKWLIGSVSRIELLWDNGKRRIAFKRAPDDDDLAYKLSFSKEQNSADVALKAFMKHTGVSSATKIDIPLEWNDAGQMFEAKFQMHTQLNARKDNPVVTGETSLKTVVDAQA
jgi:hypothetical protein